MGLGWGLVPFGYGYGGFGGGYPVAVGGGGGGGLGDLLFFGAFAFIAYSVISSFMANRADEGEDDGAVSAGGGRVTVAKLQVGLLGSARTLQRDLDRIAGKADTSTPSGLHFVLQGKGEEERERERERVEDGTHAHQTRRFLFSNRGPGLLVLSLNHGPRCLRALCAGGARPERGEGGARLGFREALGSCHGAAPPFSDTRSSLSGPAGLSFRPALLFLSPARPRLSHGPS